MPSYTTHYPQHPSIPVSVPRKSPTSPTGSYPISPYQQPSPYGQIPESPPERADSVTTGGASYSVASSSYAGSASEYDSSSTGVAGVDLLDYMHDRLSNTIDPIPLDRNVARQAQT